MSDNEKPAPAGKAKTNTQHDSKVDVHYNATELYFRPETGELLLVPRSEALAFENHGKAMCKAVDDFQQANIKLSQAIAAFGNFKGSDPIAKANAEKAVANAEQQVKKANDALREKISKLTDISNGGTAIVELIPIRQLKGDGRGSRTPSGQRQAQYGRKMTYVVPERIKPHWRTYSLTSKKDTQSAHKSVLKKDANGKYKIDKEKLTEQLRTIKPKIKADFYNFDEHAVTGVLGDWAEKWNANLKVAYASNHVDLSGQAQLMRYMAGVGASTEWEPTEGKIGLKAEAKADFALAEAKGAMKLFAPHRLGWVWQFSASNGKIYPLGAVRAEFGISLSGIVGASAVAELGCELKIEPKKIGLRGAPPPNRRLFSVNDDGVQIAGRDTEITPAKAELGVFAGAKADADVSGAIQWLNPEDKAQKFKDFAKIAPGVSAMAGAGISAKLELTYIGGKFRFLMSASLCVGVGAKGKIKFEVDARLIGEFMVWVFYQLYHANYEVLAFIRREAFAAITDIQFLVIQSGQNAAKFLLDDLTQIQAYVDAVIKNFEASERRNALAANVLSNPKMLRISTPEAKGMLLYQLTRHGKADWLDNGNYIGLDAYHQRKKAVLFILSWTQTLADFQNVLQHLTARGTKTTEDTRSHLKRFLQLGMNDMDDELDAIERRLKRQPSRGYAVAMNDSPRYDFLRGDNPNFTMLAQVEPINQIDPMHIGPDEDKTMYA
ncbi:hypothetical protein FEE59_12260 [Herbaspirillum sp. RU 5E]|nr:hypothetical protein [Herbaspirillum sp. RU 5E]